MTNRRSNPHAFTLIELMVVVAVIALMIGILLPALGSARASTRAVFCESNIKQLALGWTMYADDNRGSPMPHLQTTSADRKYWYGSEIVESQSLDHTTGSISPYLSSSLGDNSVFECPDQREGTYRNQGQFNTFTSTYGYNAYGLTPATTGYHTLLGQRAVKLHQVERPSTLVLFADSLISFFGDLPSSSALLDPPNIYAGYGHWMENFSPTTAFRHNIDRSTGFGISINARIDGSIQRTRPDLSAKKNPDFSIGSFSNENNPYYIESPERWK